MNTTDTHRSLVNLTRAARELGVTLPANVQATLDATPPMPAPLPEVRAEAAIAIAEAATLPPKAAEKAVRDALDRVVRAEAAGPIRDRVRETLDVARWEAAEANAPAVITAFRVAIAADLETLNTYAGAIPATARPDQRDRLTPGAYDALYRSTQAEARVMRAVAGLGALVAVPRTLSTLSPARTLRLAVMQIPDDLDRTTGRRLVHGLLDVQKLSPASNVANVPGFWFAIAADLGVTFDLVDADTRAENARLVHAFGTFTDDERHAIGA